jgi:hypothetical protein
LPEVDLRYYFQETTQCPGEGGIIFDNSTTWCLQEQGRSDAATMISIGQDNIHESLEQWYESQELMKEYPTFRDYLDFIFPRH